MGTIQHTKIYILSFLKQIKHCFCNKIAKIEIKIGFKNCGPEKIELRDKELAQIKEDMEELKK